jgi:hypothetical protein
MVESDIGKMNNKIEIYKSSDNQVELYVQLDTDTVWLNHKQMAELFGKDSDTIGLHLKNIYKESELEEDSTTGLFPVVQIEGNREIERKVKFYNLDNWVVSYIDGLGPDE